MATPLLTHAPSAAAPRTRRPCRVLLIARSTAALARDAEAFRDAPDFEVAATGLTTDEAVLGYRALRPEVLVTDVVLADGDAFELLRRLRTVAPHARVLVRSARHEATCAERLLRAGALGYVMRGAGAEEARRAAHRVAAGELHISAALGLAFQRRFVHPDAGLAAWTRCALEVLSNREFQVFQQAGFGRSTPEIAAALCISGKTVTSHRQHIRDKLSLGGAHQFARCAQECATRCRLGRGVDATCELDPRHRPLAAGRECADA